MEEEEKKSEQAEKMMKQVREANCAQLVSKIEADMQTLLNHRKNRQTAAMETALDVKYIRDRQMRHASFLCVVIECKVPF